MPEVQARSAKQLKVGIGGIVFSIVSGRDFSRFNLGDVYRPFLTEGKPDVTLRFHSGNFDNSYNLGEKIFDSGTTWSFYRKKTKYILRICYSRANAVPDKIAVFEPDFSLGDVYIPNRFRDGEFNVLDPFLYPFGELLMINLLPKKKGIIIHSCSAEADKRGMIFAGASGAGKSTLARLLIKDRHTKLFSDDRAIIRKEDFGFCMYGTPWHGDAQVYLPEKATLQSIFFLKHANRNIVRKLSKIEAISRLICCSFPTFWDKKGMEFTLKFCTELAEKLPCYELGFVPDKHVLDFVRGQCGGT